MPRQVKAFSRTELVLANEEAIASKQKQAIAREKLEELAPEARIPVYQMHPLTTDRYRVVLAMNPQGDIALLDVLRSTVDRLTSYEVPDRV
jgi:hypothetical protein